VNQQKGRSEPITYRVGIIGTGYAEQVIIPGFQRHPRFLVTALAARDPRRTEAAARKHGIERWETDWRALIREGGLDLLAIATPPHLHREMTLAALDAGLHVFCEKPMALTSNEAEQMLERVRETGRTAMIGHQLRYLAAWRRFGALVKEGFIGELRRMVVRFYQAGPRSDPEHPWSWWSDLQRGGGALGAFGCHYFDAVRFWFRPPRRVWGKLSTFIGHRPLPDGTGMRAVTADDSVLALLDLGDKAEVLFDFTVVAQAATGSRFTAVGSDGTLVMEDANRLFGSRFGGGLRAIEMDEYPRAEDEPWLLAPFQRLLDSLAAGIEQGVSPSPNFEDGLAHQYFLDAVKISNALGCWVDYPPVGPAPTGALPEPGR
jgi:predicted dehydrogenase